MRSILVDPVSRSVRETDLSSGNILVQLYELLHCTNVEHVALPLREALWIDEEGLLKDVPGPFFMLGSMGPFAGYGVLLHDRDDGDISDAEYPLDLVQGLVSFPDIELVGLETVTGTADTPFGRMPYVGEHPIYAPKQKRTA